MTASKKVVQVSRTSLSLSALDVNDEGTYYMMEDGFTPGGDTWRKTEVDSPFVDGTYEVGAVRNDSDARYLVAVKADNQTALHTAVAALRAAIEQRTFTWQITIDGVSTAYACKRGDTEVFWEGPWIDDDENPPIAVVACSFQRRGSRISGAL